MTPERPCGPKKTPRRTHCLPTELMLLRDPDVRWLQDGPMSPRRLRDCPKMAPFQTLVHDPKIVSIWLQ
eukprot:1918920-Pyramimonas_sp.AAC.1